MTVHVVCGPPCAGKSTFVEHNAAPGVPRFDFDRMATVVGGVESNHDRSPAVNEVTAVLRRAVMGWLTDPESVVEEFWLIDTSPSKGTVERLMAVGAVFHLVDPGMDECLARAVRDGRPEGTENRIRAWYANPPELPGGNTMKGDDMRVRTAPIMGVKERLHKAGDAEPEMVIEAYASVFDVPDSYGDIVRRGAFKDTLAEWAESGKTIPLLYGHDFKDPFMNIGGVVDAVEDERGLKITAKLDPDNDTARQVFHLVQSLRLSEMSFAFQYRDASVAVIDDEEFLEVRSVELFEVSIVPIGANRETEILSAKAADEIVTAVKQASLDPAVAAAVVEALTRSARDGATGGPVPPTVSGGAEHESETEARARSVNARLAIAERTNHE